MEGPASFELLAAGQEAEIFAWGDGRILRLFRTPRSRAALEHEVSALAAVGAVTAAVPRVYGIVEARERLGLVMERIEGASLLAQMNQTPLSGWSGGIALGGIHASLHAVRAPPSLPVLKAWLERRCANSPAIPGDIARVVLPLIGDLPDGDSICHGDFHPGNVLMRRAGPVVIDWSGAMRGDATADHARTLLALRFGMLPPKLPWFVRRFPRLCRAVVTTAYERAYQRERSPEPTVLHRWLLVRAVERLTAGISDERDGLLRFLRRAIT